MAEPEWQILINFNKSPPSKNSKGDFYHIFLAYNIQDVKIRQFRLQAAEPKDETPGDVPFIIGKSQDIENDCI